MRHAPLIDYLSRTPGAGVLLSALSGNGLAVHPRLVVRLLLVAELDGVAVLAVHLAVHTAENLITYAVRLALIATGNAEAIHTWLLCT